MKRSILILTALTLVFGAQSIRVLLPYLTFYWRATLGFTAGQVVAASFAPVAVAALAPLLGKRFGLNKTLRALGVGLLMFRLVEQFWTTPAVDVWAALGETACFMGLLPLLYWRARAEEKNWLPMFSLGILLGLSLDTALRGITGTLDLSWIPGVWSRLVIAGLGGGFALVLWRVTSRPASLQGERLLTSLPLIGLGPLLFVEWQILQNQGWVTTLTGWPSNLALAWIMLANVGALAAAALALSREWPRSPGWALVPGALLTGALLVAEAPGWIFAVGLVAGVVSAGLLLVVIVGAGRPLAAPAGVASISLAFGLAMLCIPGLTTLYYVSLLVPLWPFARSALAPVVGAGLAACALGAAWQRRRRGWSVQAPDWTPVRLGALLLLAPMAVWLANGAATPKPRAEAGGSVRVTTYNIRSAFGMNGSLDVEAVGRVIEGSGAEVVGLQEVSRGWLLTGGVDLLSIFSRRLSMPAAAIGPTTDPLATDGILSRYSFQASGHGYLPQLDSLVRRGYVWVTIPWSAGEPLLIMNTHLATESADLRISQVETLLNAWAGRPRTVLIGDMNALPGSWEMQMILDAGFVDAWSEAGQPARPRIDWIFHTPDLTARDVVVIENLASDHPAFAATIMPR